MESSVKNKKKLSDRKAPTLRPSDFMRARRPELFSDSRVIETADLHREVFEYHLDSLTSRNQEKDFEHFCRRLSEKELCPNLRVQTGPTGGGDSKVDSETYPVAKELALLWYEGCPHAGQEKWAFAFSAKKDWRTKVKLDVNNIVRTKRAYKNIYFVTNQFARDKERSQLEDSLSEKYRIPVIILDRSWIVKCVFENDRTRIAIETLHLAQCDVSAKKIVGPLDTERQQELMELDEQIADPDRYIGAEYQLGEDCIQTALLARGLDAPRNEIDGRFQRAERIIAELGNPRQLLRLAYNRAWTAFWWFDDVTELNRLYNEVEKLALVSDQASDLELLSNLWSALTAAGRSASSNLDATILSERTDKLQKALEKLAANQSRPNNALWAQTLRVLMDLQSSVEDQRRLPTILIRLKHILTEAESLIAYPAETVLKILHEFRSVAAEGADYDSLIEQVIDLTSRRVSDAEAGRLLMQQGYQKLRNQKPYDAIRLFGRAMQKLTKRECRSQLISALMGCGLAYESVGLLWAARASVLAGANQALNEFAERGLILRQTLTCLHKLVWLELQLGRIPFVFAWMSATSIIAKQLLRTEETRQMYSEHVDAQDRVLSILFLRAELSSLRAMGFVPSLLDTFGLEYSRMALLYAMGYEDRLRSEGCIPESETEEEVWQLFSRWTSHPEARDLPQRPLLFDGDHVFLSSNVIGCRIVVRVETKFELVSLAETIVASLEALLATSLEGLIPFTSEFGIDIESSGHVVGDPTCEFSDTHQSVKLRCSREEPAANLSASKWLSDFLIQILCRIAVIEDLQAYTSRVFGDEHGIARAIGFSDSLIPTNNILGVQPRFRLSDWEPDVGMERFVLRREESWSQTQILLPRRKRIHGNKPRIGKGPPPKELFDASSLKHKDRRVSSLINMQLWDRANWRGTLYLLSSDLSEAPIMALGFEDAKAGQEIFKEWQARLGRIDTAEELRVFVATGVDKKNPSAYNLLIGSNDSLDIDSPVKQIVFVSRINRMNPRDSINLDNFLSRFQRLGRYFLAPAKFSLTPTEGEVSFELAIGKRQLFVRPAWQLAENDPDGVVLGPDDDPIIPDGLENAPVLRLLERKKRQRAKVKGHQGHAPVEVRAGAKVGRNDPCPCGSGKKYKKCCGRAS